jgi:hypothetical protein
MCHNACALYYNQLAIIYVQFAHTRRLPDQIIIHKGSNGAQETSKLEDKMPAPVGHSGTVRGR